jgi:hypothetical protein
MWPSISAGSDPQVRCVQGTFDLIWLNLDLEAAVRIVRSANTAVERVTLPERSMICLHLTDSFCVLFDPTTSEQYDVAQWVGLGLPEGSQFGRRLLVGFWRSRPVTLRSGTAVRQDAAGSR